MTEERAVLAGGCFWGVQDLIRRYDGVLSTRVGYTGGSVSHATYRNHGSHAEAVEIIFDPARVSYRQILELFFQIHDPTTRNRQGNDVGTSYRSAIFYTSDEQKRIAEDTIADVDASGLWPGKVVTEVVPAGDFWEAEPEHQDYLQRYPDGYTCHFVRPNWRLPIRTDKVATARSSSKSHFRRCVMQCTAPVRSMLRAGRIPKVTTTTRMQCPKVLSGQCGPSAGVSCGVRHACRGYFGANNAPPAPGHRLFHVGRTSQQLPSP